MMSTSAFVRESGLNFAPRFRAVLLCSLAAATGAGCIGERPPTSLPPVDRPQVRGKCQGASTRLDEDVHISSPADLESYAGCRVIEGNVVIEAATGVVDLNVLSTFESIDGYLNIAHNPDLTSMEGLAGLTRVRRGISIESNPVLEAVRFDAIEEAQGNVFVFDNAALTSVAFSATTLVEPALVTVNINGVETLVPQGGGLFLVDNPALTTLDFGALVEIDGDLELRGLSALSSMAGFEALETLTQNLRFGVTEDARGNLLPDENGAIVTLDGLNALETVGGDVVIGFMPRMQTVEGLGGLEVIDGDLVVLGNLALLSLAGMDDLVQIGGDLDLGFTVDVDSNVVTFGNAALETLSLNALEELGGDLIAAGNASLRSMKDLPALERFTGDILVVDNRVLADLEMPPQLLTLPGDLVAGVVTGANGATVVLENGTSGFGAPAFTEVEGDLVLGGLTATSLDAFSEVTRIGGQLRLIETRLATTAGMDALTSLGGLQVGIIDEVLTQGVQESVEHGNAALVAIEGFDALASLGDVSVLSNPALETIAVGTTTLAGDVVIAGNPGLQSYPETLTAVGGDLVLGQVVLPSGTIARLERDNGSAPVAFATLATVGGDLVLDALDVDSADFSQLTAVTASVRISRMPALQNAGLEALISVGEDLEVRNAEALTTLSTGPVVLATVGADFHVDRAPNLDLTFAALTAVGGELALLQGAQTAMDFALLTSVGADLRVQQMNGLQDLSGLSALTDVGGDVALVGNDTLADVSGLGALVQVEGHFVAQQNPLLDVSALDALNAALADPSVVLSCGNLGEDAC